MVVNRRQFIQISGATAAGLAISGLGVDLNRSRPMPRCSKPSTPRRQLPSAPIVPWGVALIVHTSKKEDGHVINIEGDPDHVINRGSLCSMGAALAQLVENNTRITAPMHRAPYSAKWEKVSWDWALSTIASG